jgi:outer membrane biosynthesis protein TonB
MDKQTANKKLKELRDSLSQVLDGKSYSSSEEIKEQSAEAIKSARKASSTLKKSFIEKIKDLPVVQKVSELGTAGSVAVSTAAVAQTSVAVDQTEVFVASVANDIVEERIEVPMFIDTFVDFHVLNDWGQVVIAEKMEAAQEFVDKVEAIASPSPSRSETPSEVDPKPSSSESSPTQKSDGPSEQKQAEGKSEEQSKKEPKVEEKDSSKNDSEKDKEDKQQQNQEQQTEDKQESQEEASSEPSTEPEDVKELPIVETPIDNDSSIRQVSPTM